MRLRRPSLLPAFILSAIVLGFSNIASAEIFGLIPMLNPEGSRLFPQPIVLPRHAGKPDLRWRTFDWKYLDQDNAYGKYRLYFYPEEQPATEMVIPEINEEMRYLQKLFNFTPPNRFSYLLFNSQRNFQQANIFDITEGVQGVTSTTETTMALPYTGELRTFQHVSTHEMVHQFQYQKANELSKSAGAMTLASVPLWFIEGMAEYYSLNGMDEESRFYLRDLVTTPNPKDGYKVPKFFETGAYDFISVYKIGQAKIDFLEKRFGTGTSQKILELSSNPDQASGGRSPDFPGTVSSVVKKPPEQIESDWSRFLSDTYRKAADELSQDPSHYQDLKEVGETLDSFDISPDESAILVREINPLSRIVSINIIDLKNHFKKSTIIDNDTGSILSLYFMQTPSITISSSSIAYSALTLQGPELHLRSWNRDKQGHIQLGKTRKLKAYEQGLTQIEGPCFSPDGKEIVFAALTPQGLQNLYRIAIESFDDSAKIQQLTQGHFSWRTPFWSKSGEIIAASDQTETKRYNLFKVNPKDGQISRLTQAPKDQLGPQETEPGVYLFQSWESGSSQIHHLKEGVEVRLTEAKTLLSSPIQRGENLYTLGFHGGRYHLYKIQKEMILSNSPSGLIDEPRLLPQREIFPYRWQPELYSIPSDRVNSYKPFVSNGIRLENIMGFIGTGSAIGLSGTASDLMRNYSISADALVLRSLNINVFDAFFSRNSGRVKWTLGLYQTVQSRIDSSFSTPNQINSYMHREYGGVGVVNYPHGPYSHFEFEVRIGNVNRTDFSNPILAPAWNAQNPGNQFLVAPIVRWGHDRLIYEPIVGPLKGYSLLLEANTDYFPSSGTAYERLRLDASHYVNLVQRTILALRFLGGAALGGEYTNTFLVSSDDILRAYPFGDPRLQGNYVVAGNLELRFPIGSLIGFPYLRGLAAMDFGSVYLNLEDIGHGLTSSTTLGIGLYIPPLAINLMESFPLRTAPGPHYGSVFHFTLRYLYF